jgi:hypothetical protein
MKSFLKRTINGLGSFLLVTLLLFWFGSLMKFTIEFISPLATVLFVGGFTVTACRKWFNGLLAIIGIVLYASSWLYFTYNTFAGSLTASLGIGLWFIAAYRSITPVLRSIRQHLDAIQR